MNIRTWVYSEISSINILFPQSLFQFRVSNSIETRMCFDTTVIGGTTYYYVVTGVNIICESNVSNEVSVLPASVLTSEQTTQLSHTTSQTTTKSQSTLFPGVLVFLVMLCTLVVISRKQVVKK